MDSILRFLALMLASRLSSGQPLREAVQKKSDAYMAYASDYAQRYEPMTFAAVSLHPPMPVLHILSPNPINPMTHNALATSLAHAYAKPYSKPNIHAAPAYSRPYDYADWDIEPQQTNNYNTVLYARPDKYGGYTYYRKTKYPSKTQKNKKRKPNRPVILRIHKYRIVRDR